MERQLWSWFGVVCLGFFGTSNKLSPLILDSDGMQNFESTGNGDSLLFSHKHLPAFIFRPSFLQVSKSVLSEEMKQCAFSLSPTLK